MSATITTSVGTSTTSPELVLGYETARASSNIYHDTLAGGRDVTLRPATFRAGTLRLLYLTEAAAAAALTLHAAAATFRITDTDRPSVAMTYAVDGQLRLVLHESRSVWTLEVPYQEVTP